jgi:hypothetical protein
MEEWITALKAAANKEYYDVSLFCNNLFFFSLSPPPILSVLVDHTDDTTDGPFSFYMGVLVRVSRTLT